MPARSKGPRLHWRERSDGTGVWQIRDTGDVRISTGTDDRGQAEIALGRYIEAKQRRDGPSHASQMSLGQVLSIYGEEHAPTVSDPARIGYAIAALVPFWADIMVSDITGGVCRRYTAWRDRATGTVRRELGVLQAAINYCYDEGYLLEPKSVSLPEAAAPVERWLTRQEAAWLLRAARSLNRDGRHLADFILCGLYTGTRKSAILALRIDQPSTGGGHVDTVNGVLYRRAEAARQTKKRQPPARLPTRYLAHLRRQAANGRRFVVERKMMKGGEFHAAPVSDIRKGWLACVVLAEKMASKRDIELSLTFTHDGAVKRITPHVLRHTAITWALQGGARIWDAAGFFGASPEMLERVYGHHSPHHQETAVRAIDRR